MKKLLLLIMCCFLVSTHAMAQTPNTNPLQIQIHFSVNWIDPTPMGHKPDRSPIDPPTVYQEDYILSFASVHPAYTLCIKDVNDNVVYSTIVSDTDTTVVLPSTLSGTYEIDLITDDWCFWGYIEL